MYIFRLKMHIFKLDFYIFSLKIENYPACDELFHIDIEVICLFFLNIEFMLLYPYRLAKTLCLQLRY